MQKMSAKSKIKSMPMKGKIPAGYADGGKPKLSPAKVGKVKLTPKQTAAQGVKMANGGKVVKKMGY